MVVLKLTLQSGKPLALYLNGSFAVNPAEPKDNFNSRVSDGRHNNGGWPVMEKYEDIISRIEKQLLEQK
jgi:hypothetical protein